MIAFQIEPASLCLGTLLVGLPLLAWMFVHHRHAQQEHLALRDERDAVKALLADQVQATAAARTQLAEELAVLHAEHHEQMDGLRAEHTEQMALLRDEGARAVEDARNELSIVTFPYDSEHGDKGWVVDDRTAEVGYQYQMFIRGVPCFEPHKVVLHRLQKKEVNQDKVASLSQQVLGLLENVASKHPAMTVAKKFVPVLR